MRSGARLAMVAAMALAAVVLAGCSVDGATPPPYCGGNGSVIIVAQSVPGASLVPCLEVPPDGWSVDSVSVTDSGTEIVFDSDRAGNNAATLRYLADCSIEPAVNAPTDQPGTSRWEDIRRLAPGFEAAQYYLFEGGCVSWTFSFSDEASATEAVGLSDSLVLVTRVEVQRSLAEDFMDADL